MPYFKQSEYHLFYSQLVKDYTKNSSQAIYILVAKGDLDAICGCKILTTLLMNDYIPHKIIPINGYSDLSEYRQLENSTVMLLNIGSVVDIREFIPNPSNLIFIIDCNRPLNLDNLFSGDNVYVFDDGDVEDLEEEKKAYRLLLNQEEDSNDDNHIDDENGYDDSNSIKENDNLEDSEGQEVIDEEVIDEDASNDENDSNVEEIENRMSVSSSPKTKLNIPKRMLRKIIKDYYSLNYYGNSSSYLLYIMANQLGRSDSDLLWFAIVGTCFLFCKFTKDQYLYQLDFFRQECAKLWVGPRTNVSSDSSISPDDSRIVYNENELQLMLFRHWSLYESMFHSNYVATKLGLWRERGRQKLRNLLAKMGFSLSECNQPYIGMDLKLRKVMHERLSDYAKQYGLLSLTYPSFKRHFGFKSVLSAEDFVYSLMALLESSSVVLKALNLTFEFERRLSMTHEGFFLAFEGLQDIHLLNEGIVLAKEIQKAVVRMGTSIIEEKTVRTLKSFRLVVLKNHPDLQIFLLPLTLYRLAIFMVDSLRESGKSDLPFVIAAFDREEDKYLVIGLDTSAEVEIRNNQFVQAFSKTAEATQARITQDRFDRSVIELASSDLTKFMEDLQIVCHK